MFSLFSEYPIVTVISIVLVVILVSVIGNVDTRLGEIIGTNNFFEFLVFILSGILLLILAIVKVFQGGEVRKKKNRARASKVRNSKEESFIACQQY